MEENVEKLQPQGMSKGIIVVILVVIIVLAAGVYEFRKTNSTTLQSASPTTSQTVATPTTAAMKAKTSPYKNGTYSASGRYLSPGGEEQVGVSVILKDGKIVDVTFTPKATRPNAVKFQGLFAGGYKPLVLGKNIDEVSLDEVSGSSLTPKGFNDALTKIKAQAKS